MQARKLVGGGGAAPQTATFSRFLAANILSEIDIKKGN